MREILSGNEAIARGAWEAGVKLAAAYPGTPSTEILENMARSTRASTASGRPTRRWPSRWRWAPPSPAPARLAAMKHVGVNVAADPLFTASYTGVKGGLVLVTADDPAMHSSQNEQDNRNYARFAKVPMLEPSDSQEAKDFVKLAFDAVRGVRHPGDAPHHHPHLALQEPRGAGRAARDGPLTTIEKETCPSTPCCRASPSSKHPKVERAPASRSRGRRTPCRSTASRWAIRAVGIVATGAAYQYAREAFPDASFLKLGMTYPLPATIDQGVPGARWSVCSWWRSWTPSSKSRSYLMGVTVDGGQGPACRCCGELDPGLVARTADRGRRLGRRPRPVGRLAEAGAADLPQRPPTLCPGCSHRGIFTVLKKLGVFVSGDIGCYTLGALPPIAAMHSCVCMGARDRDGSRHSQGDGRRRRHQEQGGRRHR